MGFADHLRMLMGWWCVPSIGEGSLTVDRIRIGRLTVDAVKTGGLTIEDIKTTRGGLTVERVVFDDRRAL